MIFSLFCILVGSSLAPPLNKRFKLCLKSFFSLIQCKRVLEVLKTWSFLIVHFGRQTNGGGAIAPLATLLEYHLSVVFAYSLQFCRNRLNYSLEPTLVDVEDSSSDTIAVSG